MIGAPSFSQSILWIQPTRQCLPRNSSSSSVNFHFPISPLLVQIIILTIPTNTPFLYNSAIFHFPLFAYKHTNNLHQKYFPSNILPIQAASRDQGVMEYCENWHCFNLSLLPKSMDSHSRAHSQSLILYPSESKKLIYCRCDKPSNPLSLIPSTCFHYFHIQLIPPQELTLPWKPVG